MTAKWVSWSFFKKKSDIYDKFIIENINLIFGHIRPLSPSFSKKVAMKTLTEKTAWG